MLPPTRTRRVFTQIPDEFLPPKLAKARQTFKHSAAPSKASDFRKDLTRHPSKRPQTEQRSETALEDPEGKALRENLIDSDDVSHLAEDKLVLLIGHLREYKRDVASRGDYDEAQRAKSLFQNASSAYYHRKFDKTLRDSSRQRYREGHREQKETYTSVAS
jgi:hypothetical protein